MRKTTMSIINKCFPTHQNCPKKLASLAAFKSGPEELGPELIHGIGIWTPTWVKNPSTSTIHHRQISNIPFFLEQKKRGRNSGNDKSVNGSIGYLRSERDVTIWKNLGCSPSKTKWMTWYWLLVGPISILGGAETHPQFIFPCHRKLWLQ